MANKIVQLIDKNDDNIFPLASDPNAAHITMTTTDPGEGAALGQNEFVAVYGGDPIIMDYSTSEVNTGTKWIDGKHIYKRTFSSNGKLTTSQQTIASNAIPSGATLVKGEGVLHTSTGFQLVMPFYSSSTDFGRFYTSSDNALTAHVGTTYLSATDTTCSITLYYTKSSS